MAGNFVNLNTMDASGLISGIVGGKQLADALAALGPKVENRIVNRALKNEMEKLTADIRSRTPDDTGELVDSISLKRKYSKKNGVVLFDIASRGDVSKRAHLTEWGRDEWTGDQKIRGGNTRTITLASTRPGVRMFSNAWDSRKNDIVPRANYNIKLFVGKEWKKIARKAAKAKAL